ncbi:MAG: SPOR domain-containing protein [Betaproteobacteria bacterium]|nr:SPOR domain-containing protein [Betaproteobacteria bacterium]
MPEQPSPDEQTEIKKRAIRRALAAGILVAAAISALTVLTHYKSETPAPQTGAPTTVLPPEPAEPPPPAEIAAPPTAPAEPEVQPSTPPPPPPEVVNVQPAAPSAPPPMTAKPAPAKPAAPAAAQHPAKPVSMKKVESLAEVPQTKTQPAKPAVAEKSVESAPPPAPAKVAEPAAKGYAVQLGVFSNLANAQQLQERLTQNGIKSYTETKLHVGPFQNKAEADQAIAKLRALGINGVVVPVR